MEALKELLYKIPNVPHDVVPRGNSELDNEEIFNGLEKSLEK